MLRVLEQQRFYRKIKLCATMYLFSDPVTNMQLLYFITTVTNQGHSARHHQRAGYSALPSV